jgi:hypothetical protein
LAFSQASGVWSGYVEAPKGGLYKFSIEPVIAAGPGAASATITVDGQDKPFAKNGPVLSNTTAIELRAGTLYPIAFTVENGTSELRVRWQTRGLGWEVIPPRYLYSATLIDHLRATYVRFLKAVSLAAGLKLAPSELAYFAVSADYRIGTRGWLNCLPVAGSPDSETSMTLLKRFEAVLDFSGLKARLAPHDERLLTVLKNPDTLVETPPDTPEADKQRLLLALTRWDAVSLDALLLRFGKHLAAAPDEADRAALKDLGTFVRVSRAYGPVKKIGISAAALIAATTNEPQGAAVRTFKAALRARYEESDWLNVLRPINDELRSLQRDALVAYILHQLRADPQSEHIDTPEKLFEYFLMDVEMDPCMQTSRVRHVLSSVQLFVERCFMNLETGVAPSFFDATQRKRWAWMKRYRVWEANRKIWLWPENWVEPELRGDQSPFFKEAMSELLQGDITEDRAATSLLNYLSKLQEVEKLEPCGIHFVEAAPGSTDEVAHVVARTAGPGPKYFYRRNEPSLWTPWEQIKLDIEDKPVIPVVWQGRLFLFWLKILKDTPLDPPKPLPDAAPEATLASVPALAIIPQDVPKVTVKALLCWSEYYNGKWQPSRTSAVDHPASLGSFSPTGFNRSALRLSAYRDDEHLGFELSYDHQGAKYFSAFLLSNTHSQPTPLWELNDSDKDTLAALHPQGEARNLLVSNAALTANLSGTSWEAEH